MTYRRFLVFALVGSASLLSACGGATSDSVTPGSAGGTSGGSGAGGSDAGGTSAGDAGTAGKGGSPGGSAGSQAAGKGGAGAGGASTGGKGGAAGGQGGTAGKGGAGGQGGAGPGQGGSAQAGSGTAGSAGGAPTPCSDCIAMKCQSEQAACAADPKCSILEACVTSTCPNGGTSCLIGCAMKAMITDPNDPAVAKAQALGQCGQQNCSAECTPGGAGGAGGSGTAGAAGSGTAGAPGTGGGSGTPQACQMATQACFFGGPCQAAGMKCQQTPGCLPCMMNGGTGAKCANNAAYQAIQQCTCANATCSGCCFP